MADETTHDKVLAALHAALDHTHEQHRLAQEHAQAVIDRDTEFAKELSQHGQG